VNNFHHYFDTLSKTQIVSSAKYWPDGSDALLLDTWGNHRSAMGMIKSNPTSSYYHKVKKSSLRCFHVLWIYALSGHGADNVIALSSRSQLMPVLPQYMLSQTIMRSQFAAQNTIQYQYKILPSTKVVVLIKTIKQMKSSYFMSNSVRVEL
jgi:hypothetical protein